MLSRRQRRPRPGFTLLEVVLATAIAVLLLGGLYVAVDMQLRYAQDSRDIVQESTLSRALFDRMDRDGSKVVDLSDPARFRLASGSDTGTASSTTSSTTGTSTAGAASSATASSTTGAAASSGSSTSTTSTDSGITTSIVVPLGVIGDSQTLHLFISSVPREALATLNNPDAIVPVVSDLRRVSYWLTSDGSGGLARQEVPIITSDDALENLPPGLDNESSFVIADEVTDLNFQYFDGTDWQDSWDSTTLGADGITPIGSPRAIAVTLSVARPTSPGVPQTGDPAAKTYRHVIVIPSANGTTVMTPNTGTTGTTGTGATGSGTTGGGSTP